MARWTRRGLLSAFGLLVVAPRRRLGAETSWPHAPRLTPHASQGLGQFGGGAPPCKADETPTPAAPQGPDYKPKSPQRSSFIDPAAIGTKLLLTGTVSGLTCGPIKHARVDFWQADSNGVYDTAGFRFRGHQFTDDKGRYRLETVIPGSSGGAPRRLYVKVEVPGKPPFTTQLFFPDDPRNKTDAAFRSELVMKVSDGRDGKTAVFDIVLNT